ncbi:hypothetical protein RI129_005417 [Pyrocoelia pectoralis]|uniref:Cytochrome P450 n=1 Tax=Pyrocoelia pectoralis TaxID=417401 RepID=A0AAN7VKR4_9COLE
MLIVVLLCSLILYFLITRWFHCYKFSQYLAKIPGPKPLPILGNIFLIKQCSDIFTVSKRLFEEYGGSFVLYLGPMPRLAICEPKTAEFVLSSQAIIDKSYEYNYFHDWLGTGLLTSTGNKWKSRRKLLTPTFHFQILEKYITIFNSQSDTLIETLNMKVDKEPFDIFPYITLCTLDIICEAAMGLKINAQKDSTSPYVMSVKDMCRIILERVFSPLKMVNFIYKFTSTYQQQTKALSIIHGFTNAIIRSRKANFVRKLANGTNDDGFAKRIAFLDLLLEYNLTDEAISEEVETFMFEGHDTTAAGISFALYCLSKNPDIQLTAVEELRRIFDDDNERAPTYQDLQEMKYLEMVIKESLRLYPPVPIFSRFLKEDVAFNGAILPKGLTLMVYTLFLHRDPHIFPDPEKFDPDRFLPENVASRSPYAYVPFSAGPRNCIGQRFAMLEMKSTISKMLRKFEILPVRDHEPDLCVEVILKSYNGLPIRIKPRCF